MCKATKIWLVTAAALVLIGCIMFTGVMSGLGWDFTKLSTVQYETNIYDISEAFDRISMNTDTADIVFVLSDDGRCAVECYEQENAKHSVITKDGTLTVELMDERSVYDYIGIHIGSPRITFYLPEAEYAALIIRESTGSIKVPKNFSFQNVDISSSTGHIEFCASALALIKISTSTGDIRVENVSAGTLDLSVSTGKATAAGVSCVGDITVDVSTGMTELTDVVCKNLTSSGNTGDISLKNVIAAEMLSIVRSTGDVSFDGCDANDIFVETDTGDVCGSLLSDKVFITEASTGRIDVPKTMTGGRCEISTDTGDIRIEVQ